MPDAWDGTVELDGLPEPGSPEFIAGLASDEFTEGLAHLRMLRELDHEAAEVVARHWRRALDSVLGAQPCPDR